MNIVEELVFNETKKNQKNINLLKIIISWILFIIFIFLYLKFFSISDLYKIYFLSWYLVLLSIMRILFNKIYTFYKYINTFIDIIWIIILIQISLTSTEWLIYSLYFIPLLLSIIVISGLWFQKFYTWVFWFFSIWAIAYILNFDWLLDTYSILILFLVTSIYISCIYNIYNIKKIIKKISHLKQLEKFTDSDLLKEIENNPEILNQSGKEKELVIFFLDIRWFSKLSEKHNAWEIFKILNIYLWSFSKIIEKNNGIVDKYIWDCIMWYFDGDKKFIHSYNSAISIIEKLDELNSNTENKIWIWIWMHYWSVFTWWIWHENRMDYTIIGDNVNTASRLESLTREIDANIAVSKNYYDNIHFENNFIFSWNYTLKWKNNTIDVYKI